MSRLPTIEELVAALERSALPSLITEGKTDYKLMREFALRSGADCVPAGNKAGVLQLIQNERISSLSKIAFLVDRDLWLFEGVPDIYNGDRRAIITNGYSIENDLLRDARVEDFLNVDERSRYLDDIESVSSWFAAGVEERRRNPAYEFENRISKILNQNDATLTEEAQNFVDSVAPSPDLIREIKDDYCHLLRGKTWAGVLNRHLCANGREVHHPPMTLMDVGLRSGREHSANLLNGARELLS
ncbi:hypothetical protein LCM18_02130 [Qipengyuania flava]|nr:hypothetical protein LCM18_02130 [Qipengyuania flava]